MQHSLKGWKGIQNVENEEEQIRKDLIKKKEDEIKKILMDDSITYGMAKTILNRLEAELLREGETFLRKTKYKNVSQNEISFHH